MWRVLLVMLSAYTVTRGLEATVEATCNAPMNYNETPRGGCGSPGNASVVHEFDLPATIWTTGCWVTISVMALWMAVVGLGTQLERLGFNGRLTVLSARTSHRELTSGRPDARYGCLDIFRIGGLSWVITNHLGGHGKLDVLLSTESGMAFKDYVTSSTLLAPLMNNSSLGVEIFLFLSGFLGYRSWRRASTQPIENAYSSLIVRRGLRMFGSVAVFILMASSPLTKFVLPRFDLHLLSTCSTKQLVAHSFFGSNLQVHPTCLGYLWYVGMDLQLHAILGFGAYYLAKYGQRVSYLLIGAIGVSSFLRIEHCSAYGTCNRADANIPFVFHPGKSASYVAAMYDGVWSMYSAPLTMCGPFLLALVMSWYIEKQVRDKAAISDSRSRFFTIGGLLVMVAATYGVLPQYWWPNNVNLYTYLYTAFFRTAFTGGVALAIIGLTLEEHPFQVWGIWPILGKLAFGAYLHHMLIVYLIQKLGLMDFFSPLAAIPALLPLAFGLTLIAAYLHFIFIEAPLGRILARLEVPLSTPLSAFIGYFVNAIRGLFFGFRIDVLSQWTKETAVKTMEVVCDSGRYAKLIEVLFMDDVSDAVPDHSTLARPPAVRG